MWKVYEHFNYSTVCCSRVLKRRCNGNKIKPKPHEREYFNHHSNKLLICVSLMPWHGN